LGLDVYVGTLTRYYTGDWETVVQQYAREQGIEMRFATAEGEVDDRFADAPPADEVRQGVEDWRASVAEVTGIPFDWDESDDTAYFTDKPDWAGMGAVQLLAAYDERGERTPPKKGWTEWTEDKVWKKLFKQQRKGEAVRYSHLYLPHLWLPGRFEHPFVVADLSEEVIAVGSASVLYEQLEELARRALGVDPEELSRESADVEDPYDDFDTAARFGLAILLDLAQKAVDHRLPLKLDY
jgi:hypothetical protein